MREIEFRGKWKNNGKWVYGCYIKADRKEYIYVEGETTFDTGRAEIIPETVGQYTGLKDKNKKRIFEGDVVRDKFGNIGIVKYSNHFLDWRIHFYKGRDDLVEAKEGGVKMFEWVYPLMGLKVIGNIHDTPKLLDQK